MRKVHITCRTHGGVFSIVPRRGRRPVRCDGTTGKGEPIPPCTRHHNYAGQAAEPVAQATEARPVLKSIKRNLRASVVKEAPVTVTVNISLPPAMQAKETLTAKGWQVTGRAWEEDGKSFAGLNASRDDEHLTLVWVDGILRNQEYQLWKDSHTPEENGRPKTDLGFIPEELHDTELIRVISGQKVTWWNKLGSREETATIGNQVSVSHKYIGGTADENPGERVITFVDRNAGGYRSFHVSALMKVG